MNRCRTCGQVAILKLSIEASPGRRHRQGGRFWTTSATITRDIYVCEDCIVTPEWGIIWGIISDKTAQPVWIGTRKCVVLCRDKAPARWRTWLSVYTVSEPRIGAESCPACKGKAVAWSAESAPLWAKGEATDAVTPRRGLRDWARDVAGSIWYGTGNEQVSELETDESEVIR